MKGSHIFWIALAVSAYVYGWIWLAGNWDQLDREVALNHCVALLSPFFIYLFVDLVSAIAGDEKIVGPFSFMRSLIPRFNKFLDKHIGL